MNRQTMLDRKYPERIKPDTEKSKKLVTFLMYLPLLAWVVVTLFPFLYMLVVATRAPSEISEFPPPIFFGKGAIKNLVSNYGVLLENTMFWKNFFMSLYVSTVSAVVSMFFCSLAGYGFAMYEFKGKEFFFGFLLITMMIPAVVSIVPYFTQMQYFGWLNTPKALYLPIIANAYGVFLMRQFTETTIPKSMIEAARIDGASEFKIYYKMALPLLKPALGTLGFITFLTSWNDFLRALVIMTDKSNYTVPVALSTLKGAKGTEYGALMTGASISILPIMLVFIFMSKWIISRLTEGAVKG